MQQFLTFKGPGTLWVDNLVLHAADEPPFAFRRAALDAMKEFKPGAIRIWSGHTNVEWGTSLETWTDPEAVM